jgi:chlorophyll(ide) b reductase
MVNVVITGGTKGIGEALAMKFLDLGDKVVVTSRSSESAEKYLKSKSSEYPNLSVTICDVTKFIDIENLGKFALEKMGSIDIWINNAGTNGDIYDYLLEIPPEIIEQVTSTNINGCVFGCQVALKIMKEQGYGHIFNMNGLGSNGRVQEKLLTYGLSKSALPYLAKAISIEYKESNVGVHNLSPGMVITDLVTKHINKDNFNIFNILCESPETVAENLVPRMKRIKGTNKSINFSSGIKMMLKFVTAWKYKNKFYSAEMFE